MVENERGETLQKDKCLMWEIPLCGFHHIYHTKWMQDYSLGSLPGLIQGRRRVCPS